VIDDADYSAKVKQSEAELESIGGTGVFATELRRALLAARSVEANSLLIESRRA
jgi:hypothetical protein